MDAIGSDDMPAQVAPGGTPSQYLEVTGFFPPLSIPAAASIVGISVAVERSATNDNVTMFIKDSSVKIVKGGAITGTEHADSVNHWPTTDTVKTYGGSSDLWGTTWTATDIDATNFGVAISVVDSTGLTGAGVDNIEITVFYNLCTPVPRGTCLAAQKTILVVKDKTDNTKDKLIWKWIKGANVSQTLLQNPLGTTQYTLCIYQGANVSALNVPASSTLWKTVDTKGYKFKQPDPSMAPNGVQNVLIKGSTNSKSKGLVKAKGVNLAAVMPALAPPFTLPVTAQLVNGDSGLCFDSTFDLSHTKKNAAGQYKGKNP